MTWQEPALSVDSRTVYFEYLLRGSYAATARYLGCHETTVRKRISRLLADEGEKEQAHVQAVRH
jgi:DNA-directed RNA polymerase specialized sigma24 family protein